jgi:kynurenine formamidase
LTPKFKKKIGINCGRRQIIGVAVDTASTDRGQSRDFRTHQVLGKFNLWGLENLANADALPPNGSTIYNMVDYLKDGSGAPSRAFATLPELMGSGKGLSKSSLVLVAMLASSMKLL